MTIRLFWGVSDDFVLMFFVSSVSVFAFSAFKGLGFARPFPLSVSAKHTQEPYPED